jgi:Cellulase (glycosyl hydrolase family 5)/Secretion system C-terminal sorting domain
MSMKAISFIILLSYSLNGIGQGTGFVRLEGKQFIDEVGNPFYPTVLNYGLAIAHTPNPVFDANDYFVGPSLDYGLSYTVDCNDQISCENELRLQLAKVVSMGFNCIRTGIGPNYNMDSNGNGAFSLLSVENLQPINGWTKNNITQLNVIDPYFNIYINKLNFVLGIAQDVGLKVILVVADNLENNSYDPTYDLSAANHFSTYLSELASHINTHPALLAYDLWNEPAYSGMSDPLGMNTGLPRYNKQEICNFVNQWCDAIRSVDPNHLITLGGSGHDEVNTFDPALMPIDFFSLHFYPFIKQANLTIQNSVDRIKGEIYWLSKVCPIPWIIGETAFIADDHTSDHYPTPDANVYPGFISTHLDADPAHHLPPWMNGSEAQQKTFAEETFQQVLDCGGSGYSWWDFQNSYSYDLSSGPENYWHICAGLLHYSDALTATFYEKELVQSFKDFKTNFPIINPAGCIEPDFYKDPYDHLTQNTDATHDISGFVRDMDGNPTPNAVVSANSWLKTVRTPPQTVYFHHGHYSFTDEDGYYSIRPYNYVDPTLNKIVNLQIVGIGMENFETGGWGKDELPNSVYNVHLKKINYGYNGFANNVTVALNENQDLRGTANLEVSNILIDGDGSVGGVVNITAAKNIKIKSEFHSKQGSETHIFTTPYSDCPAYDGMRLINQHLTKKVIVSSRSLQSSEIFLNFIKQFDVRIIPNPNHGTFAINLTGNEEENVSIDLIDFSGRVIDRIISTEKTVNYNKKLTAGLYSVRLKINNNILIRKIVIL